MGGKRFRKAATSTSAGKLSCVLARGEMSWREVHCLQQLFYSPSITRFPLLFDSAPRGPVVVVPLPHHDPSTCQQKDVRWNQSSVLTCRSSQLTTGRLVKKIREPGRPHQGPPYVWLKVSEEGTPERFAALNNCTPPAATAGASRSCSRGSRS